MLFLWIVVRESNGKARYDEQLAPSLEVGRSGYF